MKIKTKKQLILSELIEWAFENNITRRWYRANNTEGYISEVFFNFPAGLPQFSSTVDKSDTFTVEVEEEITEDTKLEKVVEVYRDENYGYRATAWNGKSINFILKTNGDDLRTETIHLINNDGTHTLIWRDGKLVE